ncbi:MAG: undecaprenyldiphospho-muramoylpentapeptide beta-N-acetylglucosaminyltransferase [Spirochaetales bacterium]|nr:undecaprenyldiphospho-muramoylpentapeptide beta-N-acetylglucosaminyltransferase [Spirochaetales bacterium]
MAVVIAFTGGGTLGHVFPALAVYNYLKKHAGIEDFFWIGSGNNLEADSIKNAGIPYYAVPSGKLRRYFSLLNVIDIFRIGAGFIASLLLLMRRRPDVLFSKGGFVSVPPVWAAALLGIPVVSHESDLVPGLATRLNTRFSKILCLAYEHTARQLGSAAALKVAVTGNPVREGAFSADKGRGIASLGLSQAEAAKPIIMVIGGSQGAQTVNELIRRHVRNLTREYTVVHQTGDAHAAGFERMESYVPKGFFKEEHLDLIAAASLVICRAGAGTLWECACIGTPMLLIPLSTGSSRGDQIQNARYFQERGAATVLTEDQGELLFERTAELMSSQETRAAMVQNLKTIAKGNAAAEISRIILSLGKEGSA